MPSMIPTFWGSSFTFIFFMIMIMFFLNKILLFMAMVMDVMRVWISNRRSHTGWIDPLVIFK